MLENTKPFKKLYIKRLQTFKDADNEKIEKAKLFPIEKLYIGNLKKTGKVLMGCCPFHKDPSPSFAIYPQTNTYNCFAGCGGGDVISFYMKLHNVDFQTALGELTK